MVKSNLQARLVRKIEKEDWRRQDAMDDEHDEMHESDKHTDGKPLQKKEKGSQNHEDKGKMHGKMKGEMHGKGIWSYSL